MKWLACIVVLAVATSAMAELTAVAVWNDGPAAPGAYADGTYPAWSGTPGPGLDWRIGTNAPEPATCGYPHGAPHYPDSDGVGKWGGALKDDVWPEDSMMYITIQGVDNEAHELQDEQGTIEFWFYPEWDPALDTNPHALFNTNRDRPNDDGLWLQYNGDGTMSAIWKTWPDYIDVGHDWTSNPLVQQDWNHIAMTWDSVGTYSYCNGVKVGENIYGGPSPAKVDWDEEWMGLFFGRDHGDVGGAGINESDGMWDSFGIWNEVRYSGATYTMPTEEIEVPVLLRGDLNEDGFVGQLDLDIVLAMWGNGPIIPDGRADVNMDDFVGQTDLDYVLGGWGLGTPPTAPVPEPATLGLLAIGATMVLRRRR